MFSDAQRNGVRVLYAFKSGHSLNHQNIIRQKYCEDPMDNGGHPGPPGPVGMRTASDPSVGVPQFPLAPQPSIIRAQQKV